MVLKRTDVMLTGPLFDILNFKPFLWMGVTIARLPIPETDEKGEPSSNLGSSETEGVYHQSPPINFTEILLKCACTTVSVIFSLDI